MKKIGKFLGFIFVSFVVLLSTFLQAQIIISIAKMFNIAYIANLSLMQCFAYLCIIDIISYKTNNDKNKEEFFVHLKKGFSNSLSRAVAYLIIWGFVFLIYLFTI